MFKQKRIIPLFLAASLLATAPLAATTLDDPMRPPSANSSNFTGSSGKGAKQTTGNGNGLHLSAIRITKDKRSATVNGHTVSVGERVAGARVLAIQASSVTLQKNGKIHTINLLPLSIKKQVEATRP